ncbi:MAG TPA: DNA recombination protein RmuC [Opitutaceae bacterium]|nr:DNA recombination protein RmuC [Opitutaceae bacterium]
MDFIVVLLAAGVGATVAWLFLRSRAATLHERLRARADENARLAAEFERVTALHAQLSREAAQLAADLAGTRADAEARLAAQQQRFTEQETRAAQYLADIEKIRASLKTEFEAAAAKLLDEKSAKFTEHNKSQIDTLLTPLRQQLTDFRTRIDTVYKTESDDRSALKAQIEQLRQLNTRITDEAHALTQALKGQAQARGAWGEIVLDRLLESSGLRAGEDYFVQESLVGADGRSRVRPDIILRLPDQRHLVIDSKVSLIDYEQVVNGLDAAAQELARKAHVAAVRRHVEQLAGKQYTDAGQLFTPDYVLMFIPIDPAFTLALEADRAIYEWAFDRRVIIVTTPMLLATLKTIASVWKQERQARNVQEIARRGGLLYDKFAGLYADLEQIGVQLARTRALYDEAIAKVKTGRGNLLSQVEELKTLGAKAQKNLPAPEAPEN